MGDTKTPLAAVVLSVLLLIGGVVLLYPGKGADRVRSAHNLPDDSLVHFSTLDTRGFGNVQLLVLLGLDRYESSISLADGPDFTVLDVYRTTDESLNGLWLYSDWN